MENQRAVPMLGTHQAHDQWLLERIAQKEESALGFFYDRYSRVVYSLVLRVVGHRTEAEEIVIDIFWQVWRQAGQYDPRRGKVSTWLLTIARTRAIDRLRSLNRQATIGEALALDRPETPQAPIEETIYLGMQQERVRVALHSLAEPQRRAIELAYFDGLSQSEIAAALNKPLGTIKTHIRTGLAHLRERLGSHGPCRDA